jgi:hypothetical protein
MLPGQAGQFNISWPVRNTLSKGAAVVWTIKPAMARPAGLRDFALPASSRRRVDHFLVDTAERDH